MAENKKAKAYTEEEENIGNVQISEQVVAVIAGIAATEVEGVASLVGNITTELVSKIGLGSLSKGVKIKMIDNSVYVNVTIDIYYGCVVHKVCRNVQEKVTSAVETMTGLSVGEVKVFVADVTLDKN